MGVKALKDRLTLFVLFGANAVSDFKLKPVQIYFSKNPRTFKNYAKSTLPVLRKKYSFQNITAHRHYTWSPKSSGGDVQNEINVVFMPGNSTPILQPMDRGGILTFKSYDLRSTFHNAMDAIDSDSSHESGQNK